MDDDILIERHRHHKVADVWTIIHEIGPCSVLLWDEDGMQIPLAMIRSISHPDKFTVKITLTKPMSGRAMLIAAV